MHSTMDADIAPLAGSRPSVGGPQAVPGSLETCSGGGDLERAVPGIRARLNARHDQLGTAAVEACLARAIDASASFRLQEFRVILVERLADRDLRHLRQRASRRSGHERDALRPVDSLD